MLTRLLSGKSGFLIGFVACFGVVALALVIQTQNNLEPCPLCITQRIIFMSLGVLFLLSACLPNLRGINPRAFATIMFVLQGLTALGGAGVAIRHWWLQAHKNEMVADCGVGFDYMFENFPLQKALKLLFHGTGDCASIDWTFLGLTLPQMGLITFMLFAGYAWVLYRAKA